MAELIKEHMTAIVSILALLSAGLIGYGSLKSSVEHLERNGARIADLNRLESELTKLEASIVHPEAVSAIDTTVQDTLKEVDTLYEKSEGALEQVASLRAQFFELRGKFLIHIHREGSYCGQVNGKAKGYP